MSERLLLHPQANYSRSGLEADAVSAIIEAGVLPAHQRITPYQLIYRDGIVCDPRFGSVDILDQTTTDPEKMMAMNQGETARQVAYLEIQGLRQFRQALISEPDGSIAIWISPRNTEIGYTQGRVVIAKINNTTTENFRYMECYGFPASIDYRNFAPEDDDMSIRGKLFIFHPEPNQESWKLIQDLIPYPEIWQAIAQRKPEKMAQEISEKLGPLFTQTMSDLNNFSLDIRAQTKIINELTDKVAQFGFVIDVSQLPCAASARSNDPLTITISNPATIEPFNITSSTPIISSNNSASGESGKYIKNCGQCGHKLNQIMKKGDQCPQCNGVYQGC